MKRTIFLVVILIAACAVCSFFTYRLAYAAGFASAKQLQKGTFFGSLDSLLKLRVGDIPEGTRRLETLCFSSAEMLYGDPAYRDDFVTKTFASELIQYRATYRTNSVEWTPAEQKLETALASWK